MLFTSGSSGTCAMYAGTAYIAFQRMLSRANLALADATKMHRKLVDDGFTGLIPERLFMCYLVTGEAAFAAS